MVSFVDAAFAAHAATGDDRYRGLAQIGYDWFVGRNSLGFPMVANGGCRDGIDELQERAPAEPLGAVAQREIIGPLGRMPA